MERLCYYCQNEGLKSCEFKSKAEIAASRVPPSPTSEEIIKAHNDIALERVLARKRACPYVNDVDPEYPGKNHL